MQTKRYTTNRHHIQKMTTLDRLEIHYRLLEAQQPIS
jgi:hypothetical protein